MEVDDRNAVVGEYRPAFGPADVGRLGVGERVEILLVEVVEIRGDEVDQLSVGFQVGQLFGGFGPCGVEDIDGRCGLFEVGRGVGLRCRDLVLDEQFVDAFDESVERGVLRARARLLVADPHRHAEAFGDGAFEELGFGLFELRTRQVVHVDIGAVGNQFVDHREVVGGRIAQFGLDLRHVDRLLEFSGGIAARPACGGVLLEDVARSFPQLHGRRCGHVVEDAHAQVEGRLAAEHRAEEDGFEIAARVGLRVFNERHRI